MSRIFRVAKRETRLFQAALWLVMEAGLSLRYSRALQALNTSATVRESLSMAGAVPETLARLYSSKACWASDAFSW